MDRGKRDPICGMQGKWTAHGEVFCSLHCVEEFERTRGLAHAQAVKTGKVTVAAVLRSMLYMAMVMTLAVGWYWPMTQDLSMALWAYVRMVAPAFLLGIAIAGVIDVFVPRELISSFLGRGGYGDVLRASAMGFAASSCSHGCLALSVELYKKGASQAAFLSFLLASPWASLPVTLLLVRLFGLKGLLIVALAYMVAVTTGLLAVRLTKAGWLPQNPATRIAHAGEGVGLLKSNFKKYAHPRVMIPRVALAAQGLLAMTLPWVALGIFISAVAGTYLSGGIGSYLGKWAWGPVFSLLSASLVEVCSEGSAPVAFEIFKHTGALGSAYVFLEAGVVTDLTEISLVAANAGHRSAAALLLLALPQVLLFGYLLNSFF
ncbi:MAG: permease [Elusimicrobiota bacterium]